MSDYNNKKRNDAFWDYHKQREALNEQFLKPTIFTEEDKSLTTDSRFEVGKEYICGPKIPNDAKEAFKLFVDYYAHLNFYAQVNLFFDTFLSFENKAAINEEIAEMEAFISEANKVSYKAACKDHFTIDDYFEYKRFSEGYYDDNLMDDAKFSENSRAANVYGKYILFYNHLKNKLIKLNSPISKLVDISCDYSLDYFTNKSNIPNQDLVNETIAYFESGPGLRVFKPLEFLNLFEKQYRFVINNWSDENIVINQLKSLPLTELEKHIVYGFILKWFGGYPIIVHHETDINIGYTKKAIEREFLNYPENTSEKDFCKVNKHARNKMDMLGIAFTDTIRNGTNPQKVLEAMGYFKDVKKIYNDFDALFSDIFNEGLITELGNQEQFHITKVKLHFEFKLWLDEYKGWIDRDEDQFETFLTKETFIEFLEFKKNEVFEIESLPPNEIEPLTEHKLKEYGFDKEVIENILNTTLKPHEHTYFTTNQIFVASSVENKIFSGFAGARKHYFRNNNIQFPYKFPQLIKEYYDLKISEYLQKKKQKVGDIYFENIEKDIFIQDQILWANKEIEDSNQQKSTYKYNWNLPDIEKLIDKIEVLKSYVGFLSMEQATSLKGKAAPINNNLPLSQTNYPLSSDTLIEVEVLQSKTDFLKIEFEKYGFFKLEKVKALSPNNADLLIKKLCESKIPYAIAMMDYLGFIKHLELEFFKSSFQINKLISGWFNSDVDGRTVRGNRSSLTKPPTEKRYTAHNHKENVEKDYKNLK